MLEVIDAATGQAKSVVGQTTIIWQKGALAEGRNGATLEEVFQCSIEKLQAHQDSPMRCRENAIALTHLETALLWLLKRAADREARGVLGQDIP